jgi:tetratricopeptide (TPR) repeat protein
LFLWGESSFFADRYPDAHDAYGGLLKKYGNTRHLDTVIAREFAIARYWEQLYDASPTWPTTPNLTDKSKPMFDTFGYAVQAYERIRMYDPRGPLADDSLMALGDAYFRRGHWESASYNYGLLCKEYPNSKYQKNAHLLGLRATMYKYQGSAYDGGPLKEADKLAQETLKQFGKELGHEQERVERAHTMIVEEQANREFIRAQYYESRKDYGAARLYYYTVIKDYPTTQRASEARERFEKIRGLPDEPPKRFKWLLDLFGTSK